MNRRQFLKGLLATFATTAVARNGVLQPDPERKWWDMGRAWEKHARPESIIIGMDYAQGPDVGIRAMWREENEPIVMPWTVGQATHIEIWVPREGKWMDINQWPDNWPLTSPPPT